MSFRRKTTKTSHGLFKTPIFMPDATRGFVKLCSREELKKAGVGAMVVNTLHLYLQPGLKIIKKSGGLHGFMNWDKPILSDSGGFQVFSLIRQKRGQKPMGKVFDDGVMFKSPLDGTKHFLTPEKSIQIQFELGTDMMVCLDDCPPNEFNSKDLKKSVERTIAWAQKCRQEYDRQIKSRYSASRAGSLANARESNKKTKRPLLFAVIQGGADLELRKKCAEGLIDTGFDGYGFGARPVDEKGNFLSEVLKYTADLIPADSLKFALGIGTPEDIVRCAKMGWDMFDCVIPTREGRHGKLFFFQKKRISNFQFPISNSKIKSLYLTLNITNSKFAKDFSAINKNSRLPELRGYSKAYLHHLFKAKEPLGQRLASLNNLEFYMDLMKKLVA